jgi:hypothetical protein
MKKSMSLPPRPEARTIVLSMKIKPSMAEALVKASKANARSKASIAEAVLEQWLKAEGYLK